MPNSSSPVPKLADVARAAGVGNATVSRALSGGKNVSPEKMQRISAAILELGYHPNRVAQSLKGASSGIVGMIVPSLSDMFFSQCAEAVESVTKEHGALLVLAASHDDDETVFNSFRQLRLHHIDGLILAHSSLENPALVETLRSSRVPIVGIDRPLGKIGFSSLLCENFEGARMATEHLQGHGYEKIISIQVKPELYTMQERLRGYRAALEHDRRQPIQEVIANRADAVHVLERHLVKGAPPVGIFAGNNLTARYICEAAHVLGISIPRDFAILSFDDFDLADTLTPPMSVVRQPLEELGRAAAKLLFQQMPGWATRKKTDIPEPTQLAPQLVIRQSCGCSAHPSNSNSNRNYSLTGSRA